MSTAAITMDVRQSIVDYAQRAVRCRLVINTQGNISVRDPQSRSIAITPHDVEYDEMTAEDIVVVDYDGNVIDGSGEPSEETSVHRAVYAARPELHAVVHTEPVFTNVFGALGKPIEPVLVSVLVANRGPVPVMPFMPSGSTEFGMEMVRTMGAGNAVIWGNHGLLTAGPTLKAAFRASVAVESAAEVYQLALRLGEPRALTIDELD
jgi:ribulose-5-phosphate 4-epimerase/fuculose-1-phosphate aldolase